MMDSRELSFDDFSAPLSEAAPLGGAGPFVINLGASSAPLELPAEDLTGGSQAYVYRIRRTEDGRIRYRLRLGPFIREEDADAALSRVRNVYPGALTATAWVEDLNAIAVQQAKAGISRPLMEAVPKLRSMTAPATRSPPEVPAALEARSAPVVPSMPEVPSVAEVPALPEVRSVAEAPALPEVRSVAEVPALPEVLSVAQVPALPEVPSMAEVPALPEVHALAEVRSVPQVPTLDEPVAEPPASVAGDPAEEFTPVEADFEGEEIVLGESELDGESIDLDDGEPTIEARALTELAMAVDEVTVAEESASPAAPTPALEFPELLLMDDVAAPLQQSRPMEGTVASPAATGRAPVLDASFDALSASLSLEASLPEESTVAVAAAPPLQAAVPAPVKQPVRPAAPASPIPVARTTAPPATRPAEPARETPLSLESTQTLRPLTSSEMQDQVSLRWFVIQLSLSDHAFDPGAVPNLDIFLLYRLYSVASVDQGRPVHALRLGFFGEEMAAQAVASYLKSYYENPTVKRVSVAERERFSEHRLDARKDVGETGQHAAIELSTERPNAKVDLPAAKPAAASLAQPTAAVRAAALRQIAGQQPKKEKPAGVFASLPWIGRRK